MQIENTKIQGLKIISPKVFGDERGYFMESYNHEKWFEVLNTLFIQDNESLSSSNVLRGLHFQNPPHSQAKLVRVVRGSVWDIRLIYAKNHLLMGNMSKCFYRGRIKNSSLFLKDLLTDLSHWKTILFSVTNALSITILTLREFCYGTIPIWP